jgi:hypothetical protein
MQYEVVICHPLLQKEIWIILPGLVFQINAEIPLIQCGPYITTDSVIAATTIITRRMINHFSLLLAYSTIFDNTPLSKLFCGLEYF